MDEPTNHLDLDAIIWLQDYLKTHPATQIIIAHDREFLDALCTRILHIENRQLQSYSGNYSDYERQSYEQRLQAGAQYQKEARQRAHLQNYIDRFRAKATKARQAQSRLKALEKLDAAPPPPPEADSPSSPRKTTPPQRSSPKKPASATATKPSCKNSPCASPPTHASASSAATARAKVP